MNSIIIGGTVILLLLTTIFFGYREISSLHEQLGAVNTSLAITTETLNTIKANTEKNQQLMAEYSNKIQDLSKENIRFRKEIANLKIWTLDPTTSETIVNKTFNDILSGIEVSTMKDSATKDGVK